MDDRDWLAERFEAHRPRLRAVAQRLLGSAAEADDAVQEVWLRLQRTDPDSVDNLGGWLTTVVARVGPEEQGQPAWVLTFAIAAGRITGIRVLAGPEHLGGLELAEL